MYVFVCCRFGMSKIFRFFKNLFSGRKTSGRSSVAGMDKSKRFALVIGIERSAKYGSCPGARKDSNSLYRELKPRCNTVSLLQDAGASRASILNEMKRLISRVPRDGMFIMTYSGHGGSQAFTNTKDEEDGKDEFLCCYDTYLKDDFIWEMVTKCRGKVFLFFDCCHSETMYRAPFLPPRGLMKDVEDEEDSDVAAMGASRDATIPDSPVVMLVWSGCPDDTYSYGDASGGLMTNALTSAIASGKETYADIWKSIKSDTNLKQYSQVPQQTVLGGFDTTERFCD